MFKPSNSKKRETSEENFNSIIILTLVSKSRVRGELFDWTAPAPPTPVKNQLSQGFFNPSAAVTIFL